MNADKETSTGLGRNLGTLGQTDGVIPAAGQYRGPPFSSSFCCTSLAMAKVISFS